MRTAGLASLAVVFLATSLPAHALAQVTSGARIRVQTTYHPMGQFVVGQVRSVSSDSILLLTNSDGATVELARPFIEEVRISSGIGHSGLRLGGVGAFLGLAVGAVVGILTYDDTTCPAPQTFDEVFCDDTSPRLGRAALLGMAGAAGGLGLGYAFGTQIPRERWVRVPLGQIWARRTGRSGVIFGLRITRK